MWWIDLLFILCSVVVVVCLMGLCLFFVSVFNSVLCVVVLVGLLLVSFFKEVVVVISIYLCFLGLYRVLMSVWLCCIYVVLLLEVSSCLVVWCWLYVVVFVLICFSYWVVGFLILNSLKMLVSWLIFINVGLVVNVKFMFWLVLFVWMVYMCVLFFVWMCIGIVRL